ncbi:MAG TPA: hypothetical protein VK691_12795 [Solirubrobacteraceae bacterium]|nr:hypothetical protein [Solirubrobacteraceae bacterium]
MQRAGDQVPAGPGELGKASEVVLAVAMPPDARRDRAQAMSGVTVLIVEEKLLADRLFKQSVSTCLW